jgi:Fe-S cluster assembly protein SufD
MPSSCQGQRRTPDLIRKENSEMTVALTRTKAEQAFSEHFEAVAAKLPGGRAVAEARKAAIGTFAGLGLPHRRIEEWKYTDLRSALREAAAPAIADATPVTAAELDAALEDLATLDAHRIVFVNGTYGAQLSTPEKVKGLDVTPLAAALERTPDVLDRPEVPSQDAVIALNTAFATDGALIRVREGMKLTKPLLVVFVRAGREPRLITTRNAINIGAGAHVALVEAHVTIAGAATGQANTLTEITTGTGAHLTHVKCTLDGTGTSHIGGCIASIEADARYRLFHYTAGTGLVRNNVLATFKGEGAKLDISGAFLGRGTEHIDSTLLVDHAVPGCESRELFKAVLSDRAHGVVQAKVIVRPHAQKTDGKQMAQALMLSEDAEFDSKPELEIYADDVVCGHGSTVADLDADLLFYMRARGIPLAEARRLLIESFIAEALDKIEDESVREALAATTARRLPDLVART